VVPLIDNKEQTMRKIIFPVMAALLSMNVMAADNIKYSCTLDGVERVIEVVYPTAGEKLPCEVHYTKEGETQVLWTYTNEVDKCEVQAESFVQKQTTWGWRCSNESAPVTDTATE
jgi:hypothetical protein